MHKPAHLIGSAEAAEILGVSRPSLYDLLGRFGLKKENGL